MRHLWRRKRRWNISNQIEIMEIGCDGKILSRFRRRAWRTDFRLDDWIYCTLCIHTFRNYRQYSATAILQTFQFTVVHALGFSGVTSRILATDFSEYHCNFKSHMKFSCHSLIPFLPLFCSCQFRRLDSTILDYCSLRPPSDCALGTDHTENTAFYG
jgi:hypothetical protein